MNATRQIVSHVTSVAWKGEPMADLPSVDLEVLTAVASGTHHDPHTVLGPHLLDGPSAVVRALRPLADEVTVTIAGPGGADGADADGPDPGC